LSLRKLREQAEGASGDISKPIVLQQRMLGTSANIYIQFSGRSLFNVPRFQNSKVGKGSKVFVSHPARESTTKLLCALPFFQLVVLDVLHDFVCFLKFVIEAGKPRPSNIAGL